MELFLRRLALVPMFDADGNNDGGSGGGDSDPKGPAETPEPNEPNEPTDPITFTPEQQKAIDDLVKARLERQQRKFEDAKQAAETDYAQKAADLQAEIDAIKAEKERAELRALTTDLLVRAGYGAEQLDRVIKYVAGDDAESIESSVAALIEDMPPRSRGIDPQPGNPRKSKPEPVDLTQRGRDLYDRIKHKV